MPLFKKKTEEERQAKQDAKAQKALEKKTSRKSFALETEIFPHMNNAQLKETIANLDIEISEIGFDSTVWPSVIQLEHILKLDLKETLLGFAQGRRNIGLSQDPTTETFIVCTNFRILFIDRDSTNVVTIPYHELNSMQVKTEIIVMPMRPINEKLPVITFYLSHATHKAIALTGNSDKFVALIKEADEKFKKENAKIIEEEKSEIKTASSEAQDTRSATERLNELKQLLYSRTITQEEYDAMKAKITRE